MALAPLPRRPVCAYSAVQADGVSSIEVIVCDDGTCWTLTEDPTSKALVWSIDGVPPIPGSFQALQAPPAT